MNPCFSCVCNQVMCVSSPEVQCQLVSYHPRCLAVKSYHFLFFLNEIKKRTQVKFSAFMPCPCSASNCSVSVSITPAGRAVTAAALASISNPGGPGPFRRATSVRVSTPSAWTEKAPALRASVVASWLLGWLDHLGFGVFLFVCISNTSQRSVSLLTFKGWKSYGFTILPAVPPPCVRLLAINLKVELINYGTENWT